MKCHTQTSQLGVLTKIEKGQGAHAGAPPGEHPLSCPPPAQSNVKNAPTAEATTVLSTNRWRGRAGEEGGGLSPRPSGAPFFPPMKLSVHRAAAGTGCGRRRRWKKEHVRWVAHHHGVLHRPGSEHDNEPDGLPTDQADPPTANHGPSRDSEQNSSR